MVWPNGHQLQSQNYRIEGVLGQRGFGITYQARHLNRDQDFVIKTPNEDLRFDPNYPKFVDRFIKEGECIESIAGICTRPHPYIVRVFDLFQEGETHCIVMDFIPGESLWQRVQRQGALSEVEAVRYFQQIGGALQELHEAGLVHRNAHPGNIMFRGDQTPLIDFGIAVEIVPVTISFNHSWNSAFSPLEQMKGSREPTVDIYTLSASLYYALSGEYPTSSVERKIDDVELLTPKELVPSLSDRINEAVLKGMELTPHNRPQTMDEWVSLLESPIPTTVSHRYQKLQQLLAAGKWWEADAETRQVMLQVAGREQQGWFDEDSINQFPCEDLLQIDDLWVQYSNGRFGFSVQKRIWQECGGQVNWGTSIRLGDRVGWRKDGKWLELEELTFSSNAPPGHLPQSIPLELIKWGVRADLESGGRKFKKARNFCKKMGMRFFSRVQTCHKN
ncbi:serine/threonine-protein kinase [Oscillatoria acuminata]|uniref:non-specific serine/threonine protein kinase n=1 Tax=Oscillatoria acuminata PCC 6304 TaxID=56110 RepID=K9TMU3_9CYAN|nr:serine/threonine-protein kinase [Oscillatoria acuminata]AFY83466.1 serine/threonine protein kinase [Oscillatoria acuminata PCC 6304]